MDYQSQSEHAATAYANSAIRSHGALAEFLDRHCQGQGEDPPVPQTSEPPGKDHTSLILQRLISNGDLSITKHNGSYSFGEEQKKRKQNMSITLEKFVPGAGMVLLGSGKNCRDLIFKSPLYFPSFSTPATDALWKLIRHAKRENLMGIFCDENGKPIQKKRKRDSSNDEEFPNIRSPPYFDFQPNRNSFPCSYKLYMLGRLETEKSESKDQSLSLNPLVSSLANPISKLKAIISGPLHIPDQTDSMENGDDNDDDDECEKLNPSCFVEVLMDEQNSKNGAAEVNNYKSGRHPKPRLCPYCSKSFGWPTDLKRHILCHTGERPFACNICPVKYTRKFLLQKHFQKHHMNDPEPEWGILQRWKPPHAQAQGQTQMSKNNNFSYPDPDPEPQDEPESRDPTEDSPLPCMCVYCRITFPTKLALDQHYKNNHVPVTVAQPIRIPPRIHSTKILPFSQVPEENLDIAEFWQPKNKNKNFEIVDLETENLENTEISTSADLDNSEYFNAENPESITNSPDIEIWNENENGEITKMDKIQANTYQGRVILGKVFDEFVSDEIQSHLDFLSRPTPIDNKL